MTKVYVVMKSNWDTKNIVGVFSTLDAAKAEMGDDVNREIEVWEMNGGWVDTMYGFTLDNDE